MSITRSVLLPNAFTSSLVLNARVAPVVVPAPPTVLQLRTVAVGGVAPWAQARRYPAPVVFVAVSEAATADASAGIPQPDAAPPCAVKPVLPDTWTTRAALTASGPAVAERVSRIRHGEIGTNPVGEMIPAGRTPCV